MREKRRSDCPINRTVELLGDRWSLIVIRDVMFADRRHYNDLLRLSEEGIASNILADRLNRLMRARLLTRRNDPTHKQKAIYSLTEASIELVPLMAQMITWARKNTPARRTHPPKGHSEGSLSRKEAKPSGMHLWPNCVPTISARLARGHLYSPSAWQPSRPIANAGPNDSVNGALPTTTSQARSGAATPNSALPLYHAASF